MTQLEALAIYHKALYNKRLTPDESCVICESNEEIRGHHWKGYDFPLDVWWVCRKCNSRLARKHDGSLSTPDDARKYIRQVEEQKTVFYSVAARLHPEEITAIREIAARRGISITTLATEWIARSIREENA